MIKRIKDYLDGDWLVVATGGLSDVLRIHLPEIYHFDKNLTLDGLALLPDIIRK